MLNRRTFLVAAAGAGWACKQRGTGFPGYVFVANAGERSVAAVDLNRFAVARQIHLENAPGSYWRILPSAWFTSSRRTQPLFTRSEPKRWRFGIN